MTLALNVAFGSVCGLAEAPKGPAGRRQIHHYGLIGRRGVQRRIAGVQSAVNEQNNGDKRAVVFSLLMGPADFPKQPPADVVVPAALNFDDNDDHRYHAHHKKSRLITQDLYMPWKNGHADSSDFNVLWQKAVSIFIYIKII
jgi:hypothetical protein